MIIKKITRGRSMVKATVAVFAVLVVVLVVLAVRQIPHGSTALGATQQGTGTGSAAQRDDRNAARKADVASLLEASSEFFANSGGQYPANFQDGWLTGSDIQQASLVKLQFYKSGQLKSGQQPPLSGDGLVLVAGAACNDDGSTYPSTLHSSLVVQWSLEQPDGTFSPQCDAF